MGGLGRTRLVAALEGEGEGTGEAAAAGREAGSDYRTAGVSPEGTAGVRCGAHLGGDSGDVAVAAGEQTAGLVGKAEGVLAAGMGSTGQLEGRPEQQVAARMVAGTRLPEAGRDCTEASAGGEEGEVVRREVVAGSVWVALQLAVAVAASLHHSHSLHTAEPGQQDGQ